MHIAQKIFPKEFEKFKKIKQAQKEAKAPKKTPKK
jgi:hypothetical protein